LNKAISILGYGVSMHYEHTSSNYVSINYEREQLYFVGLNAMSNSNMLPNSKF